MKKIILYLLVLALALSLSACRGPGQEQQPEPEDISENASDPSEQLRLIAESKDLWLVASGPQADHMKYAVTDLDENGRLELLATITEGTGQFSSTRFYEVSEDYSELQPLVFDLNGAQSEPDLGWYESFRSFKGELGNFIVARDQMTNGYAEHYYYEDFFVLRDGEATAGVISYSLVLAEDSNGDGEPEMHAYYYVAGDEGMEQTSQAFARSADDFFGYAYDRYVMDLRWKQFDEAARTSEVDIPAALADSWSAFGYRKSSKEFDELFVPLSDYYDELYENGESAAFSYGIESLPDYWMLQGIGTDLETRHASEDGVDCQLIIGHDGMASFRFVDPTDARSPIEIDGMPIAMTENGMGEPAEEGETGGADWKVAFGTDDGLNRFEAYVGPEDGRLYVTWYWWSEEDPGADPVITYMVFANGVV